MNLDDCKGMPHVVVVRNDKELRVIEFTGEDAMDKAHAVAARGVDAVVTVAVRVRQTYPASLQHLAS